MSKTLTLKPRLNEKTYGLAASRVYVFDVERGVNKHGIARAVEAQFEVKVQTVNTANIGGKAKRTISTNGKRLKNSAGRRGDIKKAYVTLAPGAALPFFDAIEEEDQKEQAVQAKVDKAAAKQAEKTENTAAKTKKPAAKAVKPAAETAANVAPVPEVVEEKKSHIPAWRGFRLRKREDK